MKQKVRVTVNGKTVEDEKVIRNLMHFYVQQNTRAHIFEDKRKKKEKYKKNYLQDE